MHCPLAAALTLLSALALAAPASGGSYPLAKNGRITYSLLSSADAGIYTTDQKGGKPKLAVRLAGEQGEAAWDSFFSPTGREIAFTRGDSFCSAMDCIISQSAVISRVTGSKQRVVRDNGAVGGYSPDSNRLLVSFGPDRLESVSLNRGPDRFVAAGIEGVFSPDGETIAFTATGGPGSDLAIHLVRPDGTGEVSLTAPPDLMRDSSPTFSPTGDRIAFARSSFDGESDVFSVKIDGTGMRNLTGGYQPAAGDPDFSPDGRQIAFIAGNSFVQQSALARMRRDGSSVRLLVDPAEQVVDPSWGPIYRCAGRTATIVGDDGRDRITGTTRADVIVGNAGPDRIDGRGGRDRICGGRGNDRLLGGAARDKLVGGPGKDGSSQ